MAAPLLCSEAERSVWNHISSVLCLPRLQFMDLQRILSGPRQIWDFSNVSWAVRGPTDLCGFALLVVSGATKPLLVMGCLPCCGTGNQLHAVVTHFHRKHQQFHSRPGRYQYLLSFLTVRRLWESSVMLAAHSNHLSE